MSIPDLIAAMQSKFDEFVKATSPRLWTIEDVANFYGLSRRTIETHIVSSPQFPRPILPTGPNGHRRWAPEEVIEYARTQR